MKRTALAAALLPCLAFAASFDPGKTLGGTNSPIVLEVFSSFDCPHCKVMHDDLVPLLVRDYVVNGRVCLVNREFPLAGQYHPYARQAALYATAAARIGKYPVVADALWKNQATWAVNGQVWETVATVLTAAEQKKVQDLAKDAGVEAEVRHDIDDATRDNVNSTPSVFLTVNGRRFMLPGVPNYELLSSVLNHYLGQ
ncbi:MAG: thioredoxin domain-containing protein [Bryobacteraceae bacterium]